MLIFQFSRTSIFSTVPARACRGQTLRSFISDWRMFKIVERDWLMNLRGTGYPFDKTYDYKRTKQNNGKRCFFITQ